MYIEGKCQKGHTASGKKGTYSYFSKVRGHCAPPPCSVAFDIIGCHLKEMIIVVFVTQN